MGKFRRFAAGAAARESLRQIEEPGNSETVAETLITFIPISEKLAMNEFCKGTGIYAGVDFESFTDKMFGLL